MQTHFGLMSQLVLVIERHANFYDHVGANTGDNMR